MTDKLQAISNTIRTDGSITVSASADGVISSTAAKPLEPSAPSLKDDAVTLVVPTTSYHFNEQGRHVKGFNQENPGIGIKMAVSENISAFAVGYDNSYRDNTVAVGVNYAPLKAALGDFKISGGITGGAAYTEHGSYAKQAPQLSTGHITAMGGLYGAVEHIPSGVGFEVTAIPPMGKQNPTGFVGVSATYRFK